MERFSPRNCTSYFSLLMTSLQIPLRVQTSMNFCSLGRFQYLLQASKLVQTRLNREKKITVSICCLKLNNIPLGTAYHSLGYHPITTLNVRKDVEKEKSQLLYPSKQHQIP